MNKKYSISETGSQTVSEPTMTCTSQPTMLHLDIDLEDNAVVVDIKKCYNINDYAPRTLCY